MSRDPFAQHLEDLLAGCVCDRPDGRAGCVVHRDAPDPHAPVDGRPFTPPPSSGAGRVSLTYAEAGVPFAAPVGADESERGRRLQLLPPLGATLAAAVGTPTETLPPLPPAA